MSRELAPSSTVPDRRRITGRGRQLPARKSPEWHETTVQVAGGSMCSWSSQLSQRGNGLAAADLNGDIYVEVIGATSTGEVGRSRKLTRRDVPCLIE